MGEESGTGEGRGKIMEIESGVFLKGQGGEILYEDILGNSV